MDIKSGKKHGRALTNKKSEMVDYVFVPLFSHVRQIQKSRYFAMEYCHVQLHSPGEMIFSSTWISWFVILAIFMCFRAHFFRLINANLT